MNVQHSPTKSRATSLFTGSHTDLTDYDSTASDSQITKRKRKQPESDHVQKTDFCEFKREMMTFLQDMKKSNEELMQNLKSEITELKTQVSGVSHTMNNLSQQQIQFRNDLTELSKSMDFHTKSFDDLKTKTQSISKDIANLKKIEKEFDTYNSRFSNLERDFNNQQQRERLHNIEIAGIPEKKNEDLPQLLLSICGVLEVQLTKKDIIGIHRVPQHITNSKVPKNIVAKLSNQLFKDSIISAMRKKKILTTTDLGLTSSDVPKKIYVNEHLTPFYKMLHKKTRDAASGAAYQYVWIRNGKIFVRKNNTSPAFNIAEAKDLEKIK
jgi:archaellum component FlaC